MSVTTLALVKSQLGDFNLDGLVTNAEPKSRSPCCSWSSAFCTSWIPTCLPDVRNEATNEIKHQYLSAEKARNLLRWKPLYDLDSALRETIDWYRNYFTSLHEKSCRIAA